MSRTSCWGLAMAIGLSLALPLGTAAQMEADADVAIPELEGLAWYRSDDLSGAAMQETLPAAEVADWSTFLDEVGATFDDIEYTYQQAFDPQALPDLGGLATVRVVGAETAALRDAVVADIALQLERAGYEAPATEVAELGGKEVIVVQMPEDAGLEDAVVYASGDTAWAFIVATELAAAALAQLP